MARVTYAKPKSGPYGGPNWRPSETTGSAALSVLYGAQEAARDALDAWDPVDGREALSEILTTLAEGVREAAEVYEESASSMEDGFGHETSLSAELREKADALNSAAYEIEFAAYDIEEFDESEAEHEADVEVAQVDEDAVRAETVTDWDEAAIAEAIEEAKADREAEVQEAVDQKRDEWADEQRSKVEDAISQAEAY